MAAVASDAPRVMCPIKSNGICDYNKISHCMESQTAWYDCIRKRETPPPTPRKNQLEGGGRNVWWVKHGYNGQMCERLCRNQGCKSGGQPLITSNRLIDSGNTLRSYVCNHRHRVVCPIRLNGECDYNKIGHCMKSQTAWYYCITE